jgi:hypothetical protein
MGDEVARYAIAVDSHAIVADDKIKALPGYNFIEAPLLQIYGPQEGRQAQGKGGQKESGTAVGSGIILEEQEITLRTFLSKKLQGIAAAAHSNLVPPGQQFLDDGDIPGGMAQPPAKGAYKNMSHSIKEISNDSINLFS